MGTLCLGKLYKIKEIKESYIKCARNAKAAKLEMIKGTVWNMKYACLLLFYIFQKHPWLMYFTSNI